jgi:aspartate kinase
MRTLIMKFGGSSVDTTAALTQVLSIVLYERERWERLILVVSALEGVTDSLIEAAHLAQLNNRRGYRRIVATIRTRHMALAEYLPLSPVERNALQADIDKLLFDMLDVCQALSDSPSDAVEPDKVDAIVGVGERLTARIIGALLRENDLRGVAIDATDLIITDDVFGNATPNMALTQERIAQNLLPMLDRNIIPVVTGFVGATVTGKPTTLGRGGSDYTASILAVCSKADEVWIWSGVDGMMTSDPREIPQARVIAELSYDEVAELAFFGARILHSRMIAPLRERSIPLRIRNVFKPQQPGTLIHHVKADSNQQVKAVTTIHGVSLAAARSGSLETVARIVDETLFATLGLRADVMISSQSSAHSFLCFVIPPIGGPEAVKTAQSALEFRLRESSQTEMWQVSPVSVITLIGTDIDMNPEVVARVLLLLAPTRILAFALGPSHCSLSLVVTLEDADKMLRRIHEFTLSS